MQLIGALLLLTLGGLVAIRAHRSAASPVTATKHEGAPELVTDKAKVDFGVVPFGKWIEATFEVQNAGRETLEFTESPYIEVVKGCCPPSPQLGKRSLKSGERTSLSVKFMMYRGMGGVHDFRVHLRTNDPARPDQTVQILSDWR
ncbi:MAG: DUF1573 domain-containing protein [Gemmatimonadetes bacterium]|nr:DUF1573 domain-containing protein [Gemmatimonadota bacterium]